MTDASMVADPDTPNAAFEQRLRMIDHRLREIETDLAGVDTSKWSALRLVEKQLVSERRHLKRTRREIDDALRSEPV